MRMAVIAFSACGAKLLTRVMEAKEPDWEVTGYVAARHAAHTAFLPFDSVYACTASLFPSVDTIVFIGACGIAVRAIAPHIRSKLTDPAVVVVDETGRFAVSLLSGHAGGANRLTERIAFLLGATPVITTASDAHAALLGKDLTRNLVLGIGCRRGLSAETIERAVTILLWDQKIPLLRVCEAATIDVKRNETGLLGFAAAHHIPLRFYSAAELNIVSGEFIPSDWVLKAVGVDNVCERAAVLLGGKGQLILKKTARDGVTVAVFERD